MFTKVAANEGGAPLLNHTPHMEHMDYVHRLWVENLHPRGGSVSRRSSAMVLYTAVPYFAYWNQLRRYLKMFSP